MKRMKRILNVTEFKAKCLSCLKEIEETGATITITRRGRNIAVVGPAKRHALKSLAGRFKGRMRISGDIVKANTAGRWDVVRSRE